MGNILDLEFIRRGTEPTSLGGLEMVATVLGDCLLFGGGEKSLITIAFCLLPAPSECPAPCSTPSCQAGLPLCLELTFNAFVVSLYTLEVLLSIWLMGWFLGLGDFTDVHKNRHWLCRKVLSVVQPTVLYVCGAH